MRRWIAGAWLALLMAACGGADPGAGRIGDLRIRDAFFYAPVSLESGAAYLRIANMGRQPDTLVEATSPIAGHLGVHGRAMEADAMDEVRLPVVPGSELVLAPGGSHLMLMDLVRLPRAGETVPITLRFARAGTVTLNVPVRDYVE